MNYFLGLDVGTTGAKAILVNESGKAAATASSGYSMFNPKPLWSEQNPEDWWKAVQTSFKNIIAGGIEPGQIKGIGLTGQMHGLVLLDKEGKVLRPCIMWNDQRTSGECEEITSKIGFENLLKITGNAVLPGFTAPKIIWVRKYEKAVYEKAQHILLPKDYIRFCLTGEFAMDVSDASGTSLLDVNKRDWSDLILSKLDIPRSWLPPVFESTAITGKLSKKAAHLTGLKAGTPVAAGAGDQAAGGIGTGTIKNGIASVVLGTSGVVFAHTDKLTIEPQGRLHSFCHASTGTWHVMGVTLSAAGSLRWFRDTFCESEIEEAHKLKSDIYNILTRKADEVPAGSEGLIFLPYLSGERTPYPDPNAKGTFTGISVRHNKDHFIRSVLEGVAYSLKDCLSLISNIGVDIKEIRISGGGAKSKLWKQILADVFNIELVTLNSTEGAPYGAALLAAVAAGYFSTVEEACGQCILKKEITAPLKKNLPVYEEYYKIYTDLYPSLKHSFNNITQAVEHSYTR
ncbi:MAG TPA: xylulokinase [Ignavibacteriaceae bacterium]|nr:xylulokinase [Ignavibacteriaceae bacterium]